MTRDDALRTLALAEPFTAAALRLAYRRAAFHAHPDRGGDVATMKAVNAAYALLRDPAARPQAPPSEDAFWSWVRSKQSAQWKANGWGPRRPPRYGGSRPEDYAGQLWICVWCRSVYRGETLATVCACGGAVRRF